MKWAGALLCALALIASACGGDNTDDTVSDVDEISDDASPVTPADDSADETPVALASAVRIDAAVDARIADAADYTGVSEPTPVAAGDDVRTDTTGFAEIVYFDGSVTRLDINTDFKVIELVDSPNNSIIRTQMGFGRTWHRVQALTGNDTYQVETTVATAVVRGTAFIIDCTPNVCTFTVLEGTLELILPDGSTITINAGEWLFILADGQLSDVAPFDSNPLTDDWFARNDGIDVDGGSVELTSIFEQLPDGDLTLISDIEGLCLVATVATRNTIGEPLRGQVLDGIGAIPFLVGDAQDRDVQFLQNGFYGRDMRPLGDWLVAEWDAMPTGDDGRVVTAGYQGVANEIVATCVELGWEPIAEAEEAPVGPGTLTLAFGTRVFVIPIASCPIVDLEAGGIWFFGNTTNPYLLTGPSGSTWEVSGGFRPGQAVGEFLILVARLGDDGEIDLGFISNSNHVDGDLVIEGGSAILTAPFGQLLFQDEPDTTITATVTCDA